MISSMGRYIQTFENLTASELKIDALVQLLGISEKQISKTDNCTFDTYSKYGEETFKVYSRDEINDMLPNEYMDKIDKFLDYSDNRLFFFNYAITIGVNLKSFFHDYEKFCKDEYDLYSEKINEPDSIINIISKGGSTKDVGEYVELLKKGDYAFIIKHILWLLKYEYNKIEERISFINDIIDLDKLKNHIVEKTDIMLMIMHMSSVFSNLFFITLNDNRYYKFLLIKVS